MRRTADLVLALAAAACTSTSAPPVPPKTHSPSPVPVTTSPSPASPTGVPTVSPTGPAPRAPAVKNVAQLPGPPDRLAAGDSGFYVLYSTGAGLGVPHLGRFDVLGGGMTLGPSVPGAADVAVDAGNVWVSTGNAKNASASRFLYRFDPSTLAPHGRVTLPTSGQSLVAGSAGLWVGANQALYLVDPSTGRVVKTIPVNGGIGKLAVDAANNLLYDSTHGPDGDLQVRTVEERDQTTGHLLLRSSALRGMVSMNSLSATTEGVWAAFATGMMGAAELLRRTDLRVVAPAKNAPEGQDVGINSIRASVTLGILWLSGAIQGRVECANPTSGRVRGAALASGDTNVVVVQGLTFVGTADNRLVRIDPGPACLGSR